MTIASRHFQPLSRWQDDNTDDFDDLVHFVCECDETTSLCGVDVTTDAGDWDESEECLVCVDLASRECEWCGR